MRFLAAVAAARLCCCSTRRRNCPRTFGVYLNCEDFKKHSFPNVLIEILDALFAELQHQLTSWFGKKKRSRELIVQIRKELNELKARSDQQAAEVREAEAKEVRDSQSGGIK